MKFKTLVIVGTLAAAGCGLPSCKGPRQATTPEQGQKETAFVGDPFALIDESEDKRRFDPALAEIADSQEDRVRNRVAIALGRIGGAQAAEVLADMLGDIDPQVRDSACFSAGLLEEAGASKLKPIVLKRLEQEERAEGLEALLNALGRLGDEKDAVKAAAFLNRPNPALRAAAARALGLMGQRGVGIADELVERIAMSLKDGEERVRFMSAFALYRISKPLPGPEKAKTALREAAAKDDSFEVRAYALRALARRGGLDESALKIALDDKDDRVAATATSVLGSVDEKNRCAFATLGLAAAAGRLESDAALIDKGFAHTARAALEAASKCGETMEIKEAAGRIAKKAEAEARLGLAGAGRVFCLSRLIAGAGDLDLVSCDQTRPYLGKQMLVKALETRIAAGAPGSEQDFKTLKELMDDPDLRVAVFALNAIAEIRLPQTEEVVLGSLEDGRSLLVSVALDAIASHPDDFREKVGETGYRAKPEVLDKIERAVKRFLAFDHAWAPVISAASALEALGDPAAEPILRLLAADSEPPIRHAALAAYKAVEGIAPPAGLPESAPARPLDHEYLESWRNSRSKAIIRTTRGVIEMELFDGISPGTVGSFAELSHAGYFDDTEIHRVVVNFVVQGGDPTGTGSGDPGYSLRCETSSVPYERGTVGMALFGKDTGGSQFFIALSRQPHLDGNYTVFGKVTSGMETADLLEEGDMILDISVTTQ